jgi:hypothetical protein
MKAIKLYKLAALLLTASAVWACTVEEYPAQMQNKVTLVTTLSPRGAVSRALSDPGDGTLTSAWAVGEEVWLYYENSASDFVETMATVTSVGSDGSATIAATLTNPKSCNASFGYPYSTYTLNQGKDIYNDQLGTLDDVSKNYNIVFGAGDIVVNGNEQGKWFWATERTNIGVAYSGFGDWGANVGTNANWYKHATGSVVSY